MTLYFRKFDFVNTIAKLSWHSLNLNFYDWKNILFLFLVDGSNSISINVENYISDLFKTLNVGIFSDAYEGKKDIIDQYISDGQDLSITSPTKMTLLHYAVLGDKVHFSEINFETRSKSASLFK